MPVLLWISEPDAIFDRLEFCQLLHIDTIAMAEREKLPEIVLSGSTL
jgi:hypothetical protein